MPGGERAAEVDALLARLVALARRRSDMHALALVGSWARDAPRGDSDVDLVLLTRSPATYIDGEDWLAEVGGIAPVTTATWGVITERRFTVGGGLEVDLGVGSPAWASVAPLDAGTRRVVTDGMRPLHDPDELLATLVTACRRAPG